MSIILFPETILTYLDSIADLYKKIDTRRSGYKADTNGCISCLDEADMRHANKILSSNAITTGCVIAFQDSRLTQWMVVTLNEKFELVKADPVTGPVADPL
jgi:hypothetical protein